eukprot:jgi/Ulvmu1/2945/UM149_0028.1
MSDAQIDAILRALGSKSAHDAAARDVGVRFPPDRVKKNAASASAEAGVAELTQVPERLLDLKAAWIAESEGVWISQSELATRNSLKRKQVDLATEAAKHRAVAQLANTFSQLTADHLGKKWFQHFEAWLFARRAGINKGADIVLPLSTNSSAALKELKRKLTASGVNATLAESICSELDRLPARLVDKIRRPVPGSGRVQVTPFTGRQGAVAKLKLTCLGVTIEINKTHYDKLRLLYARTAGAVAHDATAFTHAAMALLLRYSSLQGTHYRGGGFQAAVHSHVLDTLHKHFDTCMECFASPLNCRWPRFCSLFPDTDAPFGSVGSFFHFKPQKGSFEANPPFDKDCVARMAAHMFSLLLQSEEPLMFVVVIPAWEESDCWLSLRNSDLCMHHQQLPAGEHGYCEGAQHNRASQFRVANTDSSIFFLQNSAAADRWPITEAKLEAIVHAFRPQNEGKSLSTGWTGGKAAEADQLLAGDFTGDRAHKLEVDANKMLHAIDTRGSGQTLATVIQGECTDRGPKKRSRPDGSCEHLTDSAVVGAATDADQAGLQADDSESGISAARRKKRKKVKVASHTGKFCNKDTMKLLVAAAAQAADGEDDDTVMQAPHATLSKATHKTKARIEGKGGRCGISRQTVEKRMLQYDSSSDRDDSKAETDEGVGVFRNSKIRSSGKADSARGSLCKVKKGNNGRVTAKRK